MTTVPIFCTSIEHVIISSDSMYHLEVQNYTENF